MVKERASEHEHRRSDQRPAEPAAQRDARRARPRARCPASRLKEDLLKVLAEEGYIASYRRVEEKGRPRAAGRPEVRRRGRADRDGARARFAARAGACTPAAKEIPEVLGGLGISIVSTSKGIVTGKAGARVAARRRDPLQHLVSGKPKENSVSRIGKMPIAIPKGVDVQVRRRRRPGQGTQGGADDASPAGPDRRRRERRGADRARRTTSRSSGRSTACCAASSRTASKA